MARARAPGIRLGAEDKARARDKARTRDKARD